ncbi:MAG: rhomboid family intramembrane serine protease [Rivularia sp. (in: cyanobacteria)]
MFPLYDENPTRITPFVTYGLIGMNVLVFLHQLSLSEAQLNQFFQLYAVVPRQLTTSFGSVAINQPVPEWVTLFSSQFLHGGLLHLMGNMVYLWVFGNNIEDRLGHFKYIIFYLACGALAALCQWFIGMDSNIPSLGASGAISGILGAYLIRFPQALVRTLIFLGIFITTFRIPAWILIGVYIVGNLVSGITDLQRAANMTMETGGVAYWAHIGGFAFGLLLGPLLGLFNDD